MEKTLSLEIFRLERFSAVFKQQTSVPVLLWCQNLFFQLRTSPFPTTQTNLFFVSYLLYCLSYIITILSRIILDLGEGKSHPTLLKNICKNTNLQIWHPWKIEPCWCFLGCPENRCQNGYSFTPSVILAFVELHILSSSLIIPRFEDACVHFKYMLTCIFSRHTPSMMKTLAIARDSLSLQLCFYFMWVNCKMKALIFETKAALKSVVL